jgi:hypothetical protein
MCGSSQPAAPTSQTVTQTSIPDYAQPYVEKMLGKSEALSETPYQTYDRDRIAEFNPLQQQAQTNAANMQAAPQMAAATGMAQQAGLQALNTSYQGGQFSNQFQNPNDTASKFVAPAEYKGANIQSGFKSPQAYQGGQFQNQFQAPANYDAAKVAMYQAQAPNLQQYQMGPAQQVSTQSFAAPGSADAYMSPYMQSVVDIQQREAQRNADIATSQRGAQAASAGAFGGARQAIMDAEAARNLAMQKGDIQATGSQAAFQQAQQQFNAEQAARLQAQQSNQQAGLTVGSQNLGAQLGIQQLGAGQSLQAQMANQQALQSAQQLAEQSRQYGAGMKMTGAQQAAQYGLAAQQAAEQSRQYGAGLGLNAAQSAAQFGQAAQQATEQSRQYGAGLGMTGAQTAAQYGLAGQQLAMTGAQNAAQYGQAAQQLAEQSRQYGAGLGLQGAQTGVQAAGQLGALGQQQFGQAMDVNKLQSATGAQQQQQEQAIMSQQYQDFLNQQNYPYKQLAFQSDMLRGLPLSQASQQVYQQPPSTLNQLAGIGTAAYGVSRMAKGGAVKQRPAGLAELAISKMA